MLTSVLNGQNMHLILRTFWRPQFIKLQGQQGPEKNENKQSHTSMKTIWPSLVKRTLEMWPTGIQSGWKPQVGFLIVSFCLYDLKKSIKGSLSTCSEVMANKFKRNHVNHFLYIQKSGYGSTVLIVKLTRLLQGIRSKKGINLSI